MNGVFPNGVYKITTASLNGVVSFNCGSTIICIIQKTESGYELTDGQNQISYPTFDEAYEDAKVKLRRMFVGLGINPNFIEPTDFIPGETTVTIGTAELIKTAHEICRSAHSTQTDKAGMPYYEHPERVAARCTTEAEIMVALLHDTIEDTYITPMHLRGKGFPQYIVDAVLSVTKREGESYEDFVARAKQNPIGRIVKIHDLEDNMDLRRLHELTDDMVARQRKYLKAYHFLKHD